MGSGIGAWIASPGIQKEHVAEQLEGGWTGPPFGILVWNLLPTQNIYIYIYIYGILSDCCCPPSTTSSWDLMMWHYSSLFCFTGQMQSSSTQQCGQVMKCRATCTCYLYLFAHVVWREMQKQLPRHDTSLQEQLILSVNKEPVGHSCLLVKACCTECAERCTDWRVVVCSSCNAIAICKLQCFWMDPVTTRSQLCHRSQGPGPSNSFRRQQGGSLASSHFPCGTGLAPCGAPCGKR